MAKMGICRIDDRVNLQVAYVTLPCGDAVVADTKGLFARFATLFHASTASVALPQAFLFVHQGLIGLVHITNPLPPVAFLPSEVFCNVFHCQWQTITWLVVFCLVWHAFKVEVM
jgi:hypothetical protein